MSFDEGAGLRSFLTANEANLREFWLRGLLVEWGKFFTQIEEDWAQIDTDFSEAGALVRKLG